MSITTETEAQKIWIENKIHAPLTTEIFRLLEKTATTGIDFLSTVVSSMGATATLARYRRMVECIYNQKAAKFETNRKIQSVSKKLLTYTKQTYMIGNVAKTRYFKMNQASFETKICQDKIM